MRRLVGIVLVLLMTASAVFADANYAFWHNTAYATFHINDDPALDVTGDFTLEAWVKPPATAADGGTFYITERAGVFRLYLYVSEGNLFTRFDLGSGDIISTGALTLDAWNHIAVSRSGSTTRIFLNGTEAATADFALVEASSVCYIGGASSWSPEKLSLIHI